MPGDYQITERQRLEEVQSISGDGPVEQLGTTLPLRGEVQHPPAQRHVIQRSFRADSKYFEASLNFLRSSRKELGASSRPIRTVHKCFRAARKDPWTVRESFRTVRKDSGIIRKAERRVRKDIRMVTATAPGPSP